MKAFEATGRIDKEKGLVLDQQPPVDRPGRVRVIILLPEDGELDEAEWLRAAAANPAFDFLRDPAEDAYTLADGEPFRDQG